MEDHRWGYLVGSIGAVTPLQFSLQQFWNPDRLKSGADVVDAPANSDKPSKVTNANIDEVSAFVTSPSHWAYLRMLQSTATVVQVAEALKVCLLFYRTAPTI